MRVAVLHTSRAEAGRLSDILRTQGIATDVFEQGFQLQEALTRDRFTHLVMRWDGPGLSGVALMHRLRARAPASPPIIMLVDATTPGAIAEAADRVLHEPCDATALNEAVKTLAGRHAGAAVRLEQYEDMQFDSSTGQVIIGSQPVTLTAKEFALALLLLRHRGQPLSRDQIMVSVWGRPEQPGSRTLDAHVAQVRKRLQLVPERGWRLASIYGFGYRLDRLNGAD